MLHRQTILRGIAVAGVASGFALVVWNWYQRTDSDPEELRKRQPETYVPTNHVSLPLPIRDTKHNPDLNLDLMLNKQTLDDIDWDGKRVLVRVDYNVPIKDGVVVDDTRIMLSLNTLKFLLGRKGPQGGCKCIVLIAHLGRPGGNYKKESFSLQPCVKVLQRELKGVKVEFLADCVGPEIEKTIKTCAKGTVFLCENLRFHIAETGSGITSDKQRVKASAAQVQEFRAGLSKLGDLYVFEAFGAAHRPHSSVVGISIEPRVAGLRMQREMDYYGQVLGRPQRPFLAIIGGTSITNKMGVICNLLNLVDDLVIGGGMAYTFKKVLEGVQIGGSLFDKEGAALVGRIVRLAKEKGVRLHLPIDHVIADNFSAEAKVGVTDDATGVPDGWMALDVGPKTRILNSQIIARSKTILWNGPVGVYELGSFSTGTISAMCDLVEATKRGALTIIGGGATGSASKHFYFGREPIANQVTHVSAGGGSTLVLMEGKMLPGVQHLSGPEEGLSSQSDDDFDVGSR